MKYVSTRGDNAGIGFQEAVMTGLAPDGGLFLPAEIPTVEGKLEEWRGLAYTDLAFEVMRPFVDIPDADLKSLINGAYATFRHAEIAPVVCVDDFFIMELFHGPTLSFKDIALQFLGRLFEYTLRRSGSELNILAATSGDTGSAAIHGVRGREGIRIFVMHPRGKVSLSQERQMTTVLDDNVFNMSVEGTFDDCQKIMKSIFCDLPFKEQYCLGSVNSINWARVLAQMVYYFYAFFRVTDATKEEKVGFTVPTGNFGDILAGYMACRMGLPVTKLVLATNENDILARFFNSGVYSRGAVHETVSPAMDIQVASNFERYLYYRTGENPEQLAAMMEKFSATGDLTVAREPGGAVEELISAGHGSTPGTLDTIKSVYERSGYLLDPHTAVGVHVGRQYAADHGPMVFVSTAHPAKFGDAILKATGKDLAHHEVIDLLSALPSRCETLPADERKIRSHIESSLEGQ